MCGAYPWDCHPGKGRQIAGPRDERLSNYLENPGSNLASSCVTTAMLQEVLTQHKSAQIFYLPLKKISLWIRDILLGTYFREKIMSVVKTVGKQYSKKLTQVEKLDMQWTASNIDTQIYSLRIFGIFVFYWNGYIREWVYRYWGWTKNLSCRD